MQRGNHISPFLTLLCGINGEKKVVVLLRRCYKLKNVLPMLRKKHFFLCFPCSVRMTFLKSFWPLRYKCYFLEGGEFACSCGVAHDSAPGREISLLLRWETHFCTCWFMRFTSLAPRLTLHIFCTCWFVFCICWFMLCHVLLCVSVCMCVNVCLNLCTCDCVCLCVCVQECVCSCGCEELDSKLFNLSVALCLFWLPSPTCFPSLFLFHSLIITPSLSFSSSLSLYRQTPDQPTLSAHTGIYI